MFRLLQLIFLLHFSMLSAQANFSTATIPAELSKDVNSVIVDEKITIEIPNLKTLIYKKYQVITVFNKRGNDDVDAYAHYDNESKVKKIKAVIYDKDGEELKKYKKLDFVDLSAVDGGTLFSDSRVLVLNYYPTEYPYTVVFESEMETDNTAFIPPWFPLAEYNQSVMSSNYSITWGPGLNLRHKPFNVSDNIIIDAGMNKITASGKNLMAIAREYHSPSMKSYVPHILFALDEFHLAGVEGIGKDWSLFGKWMNDNLLEGTQELPESTKSVVKALVANETSNEAKARKIYEYMQSKTRYISVQVGIGGWKPMLAKKVDDLGYGDCKALTNYTKALLDVASVPSYYTVLYAGSSKKNMLEDFSSLQGNHVILAVPSEEDYIWLECTSQEIPFGFIGDFTDDRDVLVVKPTGGEIVHTEVYKDDFNTLRTTGNYQLFEDGTISVQAKMESKGIQYGQKYDIERLDKEDTEKYYKNYWSYINNIEFQDIQLVNNKDDIVFTENIDFSARAYTSLNNDDILLTVNALNRSDYIPKRYKDRKQGLELLRGYVDEDEIFISLPEGYVLDTIPEPLIVESQFGSYKSSLENAADGQLKYTRRFTMNSGNFPKELYKDFRAFRRKIAKSDNQKVILVKK